MMCLTVLNAKNNEKQDKTQTQKHQTQHFFEGIFLESPIVGALELWVIKFKDNGSGRIWSSIFSDHGSTWEVDLELCFGEVNIANIFSLNEDSASIRTNPNLRYIQGGFSLQQPPTSIKDQIDHGAS